MAKYRYISETLRAATNLGEVPLTNVTYGRKLNGTGELTAQYAIPDDAGDAAGILDATAKYRVIHVERDGRLMAPYVIWGRSYLRGTKVVGLKGVELFSWLRRVKIVDTLAYDGVDQASIVDSLLSHAQGQLGGDVGIQFTPVATGRTRDREYLESEQKYVGEAIEQLSQVDDGFDWRIDCRWDGDDIVREFVLDYPRTGRRAAQSRIILDLGAQGVNMGPWEEDASDAATRFTAIGAGEGDAQLSATQIDTAAIDAGDPLLDGDVALKDISRLSTLRGHARQGLIDRRPTRGITSAELSASAEPKFGSWIAGDDMLVHLDSGDDPYFPNGLDISQRVGTWTLRVPDDGGPEMVSIGFVEVP